MLGVSGGYTALYIAASNGNTSVVDLLVAQRADPNLSRKGGKNALHTAASHGHLGVVQRLVDDHGVDVNRADSDGFSPLMAAAQWGHNDVIEFLVSRRANLNQRCNIRTKGINVKHHRPTAPALALGDTALHMALYGDFPGGFDVAQLLLQMNADVNITDHAGHTPLLVACNRGNFRTAQELATRGTPSVCCSYCSHCFTQALCHEVVAPTTTGAFLREKTLELLYCSDLVVRNNGAEVRSRSTGPALTPHSNNNSSRH